MIWLIKDFEFLSVLVRALSLSLEAFALGGVLFLLLAGHSFDAAVLKLRRTVSRFAVALAGSQAVSLGLSMAMLMGGSGFPFRSLVSAAFFVTGATGIAAALLLAALVRRHPAVAAAPAAAVLGASVLESHGASRLDHRVLLTALTALHHLGTAGWVGSMLFLLLALRRGPQLAQARILASRYSAMALVSVPTLLLAGLGLSWFYIGSPAGLYGTTYGMMVLAKTVLLLGMLGLGAGNYQLLRAKPVQPAGELLPVGGGSPSAQPTPFLLRLQRFSEAEIALGLTAILAAASLTSQPPAVDLQADRLTGHQIAQRLHWQMPRLSSPPFAQLAAVGTLRSSVEAAQYGPGSTSDSNDRAWSEYNHHWAGLIVLAAALLAFAARALPPGRLRRIAGHWPLLFLGLALFILLRADPENWPLGPRPFWASFAAPDVLQHRLYAVLISAFAFFEWSVSTGRWRSARAGYVFPLLCAGGGAALLTHSHGLANVKEEMLAELAHTPIAVLGAFAGAARWLQLRLPGTRAAGIAGFLWPLCLALIGLLLLDYRES